MSAHKTRVENGSRSANHQNHIDQPTRVICLDCEWFYYNPRATADELRKIGYAHTRNRHDTEGHSS